MLSITVSCNLLDNLLDNPLGGAEITIDSTSNVPAANFVGLNDTQYAKKSVKGEPIVVKDGPQLKENVDLSSGKATLKGNVTISGEDLPEVAKPVEGAPENAGLLVVVKNPVFQDVVFEASINMDGKTVSVPPVTLPGDKTTAIFLGKDDDNPPTPVTPDQSVGLTGFDFAGKEFNQVVLDKISLTPVGTKSADIQAISGEFTIDAKYCAGLSFPAGAVLKIHRSFDDLNLDVASYVFDAYDVYLTIANPLPFKVEMTATNNDASAASNGYLAPGTPENPVTSQVSIRITKKSSDVSTIDKADLLLKLTADSNGAKIPSDINVKVTVDKIVVAK